MSAIDGARQLPPRIPPPTAETASVGMLRRRAVPLALAAGVAAAALGGIAVWQTQNGQDLKQRTRQAQQQLDEVSAVLAAPDPRTVHSRAADGALTTVVASDRQNKAVFTAAGLPATAAGKTYQLWLDHHGTMSPAGLIDHDGTAVLTGNPAGAAAIGLALEPAGGSPRPTTEPLFLMTLPA
ncbi:anti-sigma factor [Streptomyces sp. 2132.2]|uniref:anti-sigma factor n=1 Tax=Streptomyces sp. 2132.2 TaxID=2485161 RepID=UPI0026D489E9